MRILLADPLRAGKQNVWARDLTLSLVGPEAVLTARRGEKDQAKGGRSFRVGRLLGWRGEGACKSAPLLPPGAHPPTTRRRPKLHLRHAGSLGGGQGFVRDTVRLRRVA